jgi:membrane-bound lytic murein transglycosylase MltF
MAAQPMFRYTAMSVKDQERLTFTVLAYNKDDAYVDARRQLEAGGHNPREWWFWGVERR